MAVYARFPHVGCLIAGHCRFVRAASPNRTEFAAIIALRVLMPRPRWLEWSYGVAGFPAVVICPFNFHVVPATGSFRSLRARPARGSFARDAVQKSSYHLPIPLRMQKRPKEHLFPPPFSRLRR